MWLLRPWALSVNSAPPQAADLKLLCLTSNHGFSRNVKFFMANLTRHPFHLVDNSPWPILSAIFSLGLTTGRVHLFYNFNLNLLIASALGLILLSAQWWRDVSREATLLGLHSSVVELGIRWGIALFICSEVFFFVSFFWRFFYASLRPNLEIGRAWPPIGVKPFNPLGVPLLNRVVLLISGVSVTWSHHSLLSIQHAQASQSLTLTVALGYYFTALQGLEYWEAPFSFSDGAYGRLFFIATGFHGLHVIVGSKFLLVSLIRLNGGSFRYKHHTGFEVAAWYWHFVDVVWLFLYVWIYIWGSN